jgi:UDP-glucuronate decarboxylase
MTTIDGDVIASDVDTIVDRELPWACLRGSTFIVTGASGMLPAYVVHTLLGLNDRHGYGIEVRGIVRNRERATYRLGGLRQRPDFELIEQDVTQPLRVDGPVDYVVHGASPARPSLHAAEPVTTLKANVLGTINLLDLCATNGSRGFVLMSSAEIYGEQPPDRQLVNENDYGALDTLNPRACYSEGKRAAETACAAYHSQFGVVSHIARFGHIYGPGLDLDDGRAQVDFAAKVLAGQDIVLNSDGSAMRTYTYVADAVAGMFYALLLGDEMAYNIADPSGLVSIRELAGHFVRARPQHGLRVGFTEQVSASSAYSSTKRQGLDSSRLAALGWKPKVNLAQGVDRMITHYESLAERASSKPT